EARAEWRRALGPSAGGASRRMTFEEARARFPPLERIAYLNAGTFGPLARATIDAVRAELAHDLDSARAGKAYFDHVMEVRAARADGTDDARRRRTVRRRHPG